MKKVMMVLFILIATTSVTAVSARDGKSKKHKTIATKYTCTMHPEVIRSKKGKCPKCGMNLVPVKAPHNNK